MKKKLMTACFLLALICPNLLFPFVKSAADTGNAEKRELAAFPVFSAGDYKYYASDLESYINDHAAFRSSFLSLNAALNLKMFGHTDSAEVLAGKDGWLFFTGGEALRDILGTNRFSSEDLDNITSCVQKVADYYRSRGIDFIVVFPPDKGGVYREYLPSGYDQVSEITKSEELIAHMKAGSDVTIIDPRDYLKENRDYIWYYKTDTHWNEAAGFKVSQLIIDALGGQSTPIEDVSIEYIPGNPGDLAGLFHLPDSLCNETYAVINGYLPDVTTTLTDADGNGSIVHAGSDKAQDPRRLAVYRDSFGVALLNFLPRYFKNVDFYHWQAFDASLLEENPPSAIIYEVVERDQNRIPQDMRLLAPEAFSE